MDKAFIPKIFDSFTQEDSTKGNKYGSTGLGMAITKNIVELMNGTVEVSSEKGVGTEFTVVIPLKKAEYQDISEGYFKPKDLHVHVVDDDEIAAEHARMPVMDGLEATAAIRALDRPDAKTVPIIAMTANAFDEDVQRSLQVGMNAHLSKPVEPEHLYRTPEELIQEREDSELSLDR